MTDLIITSVTDLTAKGSRYCLSRTLVHYDFTHPIDDEEFDYFVKYIYHGAAQPIDENYGFDVETCVEIDPMSNVVLSTQYVHVQVADGFKCVLNDYDSGQVVRTMTSLSITRGD